MHNSQIIIIFFLLVICANVTAVAADTPATEPAAASDVSVLSKEVISAASDRKFGLSLASDPAGNLWLGTENRGIWRYSPSLPAGQRWQRFTIADGLGDNSGLAMACDREGRIWVGHAGHGLSVYNGEQWKNYDVVGGAQTPGSRSGPLGEHVVAIKVCPKDGDVWMATNAGLARYCESTGLWNYYTRAGGLPSDQVLAMAFDADGNLYCATGCDGMLMIDADGGYRNTRQAIGPDALTSASQGEGLPTNLMTDVLVANDGTVYAGSCAGLAWSTDRGHHWQYLRGKDWAQKVKDSITGPAPDWDESKHGALINDDYVSCLGEDSHGRLLVGSRGHGWSTISRSGAMMSSAPGAGTKSYIKCFSPSGCPYAVAATYGRGLVSLGSARKTEAAPAVLPPAAPSFPKGAEAINLAGLNAVLAAVGRVAPSQDDGGPVVVALPDDWRTQGDWQGRYGRYWAIIASILGSEDGFDYQWGAGPPPARYSMRMGDHRKAEGDSMRYYIASLYGNDPRTLELPPVYMDSRIQQKLTTPDMNRRQAEWNDAGFGYPMSWEGPDLYVQLQVPAGSFIMSVYAVNDDAESSARQASRDLQMVVKTEPQGTTLANLADFDAAPTLATSRIHDFWSGVYKRLFVRGPCNVTMQVRRNYSNIVKLSALMLDLAEECPPPYFLPEQQWEQSQTEKSQRDQKLRSDFLDHPASRAALFGPEKNAAAAAAKLLERLDEMRTWNPRWWALNNRSLAVLLARWYQSQGAVTGPMLAQKASALYYSGMYVAWESAQTAGGRKTARHIEQSLRYDGSSSYSGHGSETVTQYLSQDQTPPQTRP